MAQHAIEDLIEDTVYLIDKADLSNATKRDFLAGIYRIQEFYDTGYTHFRVIDILLKYKFVYRLPMDTCPADIREQGYIQDDKIYVDAGSASWQLLCEEGILKDDDCAPLTPLVIPELFKNILLEAEKQGEQVLLTQWYGLLVNGYLDSTFEGFGDLYTDEIALAIRTIAQRNNVKRLRDEDDDIKLPVLADEVRIAGALDKEYNARFWLELKKTPEAIKTAFEKASSKKAANNADIDLGLSSRGWTTAPKVTDNLWCWYKDVESGRRFIWVNYEEGDKMLMCHIGMQHKLLLEWQQREADTDLSHMHFYEMAVAYLPEESQEKKKFMHPYGGWKYDTTKSAKTLKTQLDNLAEDIQIAEEKYFTFLENEFPEAFFQRDPDRLLYLLDEGEDDTGIVPNYVLFNSPFAILLSFAYYRKDPAIIERIKDMLEKKDRRSAYDRKILEPFLQEYKEGTAMPLTYHGLLLRELMKD